ncbi:MAG: amidase [Emergencia sp.]
MYKLTRKNSLNKGYPDGAKGGNKPKKIIIHHWGVDGQKFDNVVDWLCNLKAGVSAHYVVEAGKVAKLMNDTDCAWHAGSKTQNTTSIGIECRPECTKADRETVIELVADLYAKHGVLPIVGHKDVAASACPGRWYKYLAQIKKEATAKYKSNTSTKPTNTSTNKPSASTNGEYMVLITAENLNIREKADIKSKKVGEVKKGQAFTITKEITNGGIKWGKLKSGVGYISLNSKYSKKI